LCLNGQGRFTSRQGGGGGVSGGMFARVGEADPHPRFTIK